MPQPQQQQQEKKKLINPWVHFVAGACGGLVGSAVTCPLDVVKTRLQSSVYKSESGTGLGTMLRNIYSREGIRGLWRGLGPNLVGVVPARAIHFATYASTKDYLLKHVVVDGKQSPAVHLTAAVCAGIVTSTCTNPIWLIKTRMQLQALSIQQQQQDQQNVNRMMTRNSITSLSNKNPAIKKVASVASISTSTTAAAASGESASSELIYKNSFDCLQKVVRQEGVRALFSGLSASYLGVIEVTMQWIAYEQLKKMAIERRRNSDSSSNSKRSNFHLSDTFLAAGTAKFIAAISTYPHEVLRTRLRQAETKTIRDPKTTNNNNNNYITINQPKYSGLKHVIRTIWREEGLLAFYGGLTANLLRTVPNAAIMFLCYEYLVFFIDDKLTSTGSLRNK